jgi:drug/metabolite transporter (DMT)-like permease
LPIELIVSVAVLGIAAAVTGDRTFPKRNRKALGWLGVLNPGLAYALSLAGLARITASASALLWGTEPILILVLTWLVLRQRPRAVILTLAAIGLVGVVLVTGQGDIRLSTVGVALTLAGVGACALYTVLSSRYLGDESTLGVVSLQQSSALGFALLLFTGAVVSGHAGSLADVSAIGWASAITAGALYYGVAFCFYLHGLRACGPAMSGLFINLVPVFGVTAAALLLDERLSFKQWFGCALILGAVTTLAVLQQRVSRRSLNATKTVAVVSDH